VVRPRDQGTDENVMPTRGFSGGRHARR
jgi:hypothetical protein